MLKYIGSILIYAGTAIGAGMLALPLVTAKAGFVISLIIFIYWWFIMTSTAFMLLDVNLCFKEGSSFATMSKETLGKLWHWITWLSFLLLLYSLIAAYVAEGGHLLEVSIVEFKNYNLPSWSYTFLYTLILALFIFFGTSRVDYLNRFFMIIMIAVFFVMIFMLTKYINVSNLHNNDTKWQLIMPAFPVIMVCFGSHFVIPSLRKYLESDEKKLKIIILVGSIIPLFIYICWELVAIGIVPLNGINSFKTIFSENGSVAEMTSIMRTITENQYINSYINIFIHMAIATSFLGVSLSLFDFIMDGFHLNSKRWNNRITVLIVVYLLPIIFAVYYPKGFIMALRYASIFGTILVIFLPAFMVLKLRNNIRFKNAFYIKWNNFFIYLSIISGFIVIIISILTNLNIIVLNN